MINKLDIPIEYDHFGRMFYNPIFHGNNGKPWHLEDEAYLIEWYDIIGPEEASYALDRTIKSVMCEVGRLRKEGKMKRPLIRGVNIRRTDKKEKVDANK